MSSVHPNANDDDDDDVKPEDPESEGESGDEDEPTAPQVEYKDMGKVEGYGNVGFGAAVPIMPPKAKELYGEKPNMPFKEISEIKEVECRDAVLSFVAENCCYGSGPAKSMIFSKLKPNTAFHYILETYSEARSTKYVSVPYAGGFVDGPDCGQAPGPWQMTCNCCSLFDDEERKLEVPHTSVVKPCKRCDATGYIRCPRCHGHCRVRCSTCWGSGRRRVHTKNGMRSRRCYRCSGSGRMRCPRCGATGRIICPKCEGHRQLRCFIQLTVSFKNHKSDYVLEMTDMPDHLVKNVGGDIIFEQEEDLVWPLTSYPVAEINDNSVKLINRHKDEYKEERVLKQRHRLRAVPVTEVEYTYKEQNKMLWVYGLERKVYCPDYPSQCCWGCHIL